MKPKTTALLLVLAVLLLAAAGFLPCGIRLFFGVPCPMCGITRAYMTLLDGDFCAALRYHPLFWLLPLAALLLAIVKNKTARRIILILTIIAFTAAYIIRMADMFPSEPPMDFNDSAVLVQLYERIFAK